MNRDDADTLCFVKAGVFGQKIVSTTHVKKCAMDSSTGWACHWFDIFSNIWSLETERASLTKASPFTKRTRARLLRRYSIELAKPPLVTSTRILSPTFLFPFGFLVSLPT